MSDSLNGIDPLLTNADEKLTRGTVDHDKETRICNYQNIWFDTVGEIVIDLNTLFMPTHGKATF